MSVRPSCLLWLVVGLACRASDGATTVTLAQARETNGDPRRQDAQASKVNPSVERDGATDRPGRANARVAGVTLRLSGCTLLVQRRAPETTSVMLPLEGDCRFILERSGVPQVVMTTVGPALLVAASQPHPDGKRCLTRVRAVVIGESEVGVSDQEQRIRSCAAGPFDAKMFHVLATAVKVDIESAPRKRP
jgi:hypothetical protein